MPTIILSVFLKTYLSNSRGKTPIIGMVIMYHNYKTYLLSKNSSIESKTKTPGI